MVGFEGTALGILLTYVGQKQPSIKTVLMINREIIIAVILRSIFFMAGTY